MAAPVAPEVATELQRRGSMVDGGEDPRPGVRRSCDPCGRRKKKCDGGLPSCRRCVRAKEECTYSKRAWHQPDHRRRQDKPQQQHITTSDRVNPMQVLEHSTSGATAVLAHGGTPSFKRCRLSPSPATGLVGMQENSFLSDFFGCVGFLPLTTQSHIRETMVNIMLAPASQHYSALGDDGDQTAHSDAIAMEGGLGNTFGWGELTMGPSACIFWCAVALGALVKGWPVESVKGYTQLATEALEGRHGPANAEMAKAWTILAYLYGFMGDEARFQHYLAVSDKYLSYSKEQGSTDILPVGFAEMIQNREKGQSSRRKMEALCSRGQSRPKLNGVASEHELYRYVIRSFQVFEQAIYSKLLLQSAADQPLDGGEPSGEESGEQQERSGAPLLQAFSDAMASVWTEAKTVQFGPLEDVVDRPSIRTGIGGMLINGYLGFEAAGKGHTRNMLKRFGRCAEVFTRFPGLCRSTVGVHEAHMMLGALAALDDPDASEVYESLRAAYNPCRPCGTSPVPPPEEWQGMSSICGNIYCRAIERAAFSGKLSAFSKRANGIVPSDIDGDKGDEMLCLGRQNQSGQSLASNAPQQEARRFTRGAEFDKHAASSRNGSSAPLMMPAGLDKETIDDIDAHDIAAADWLDVTHSLLQAADD